MGLMDTIWDEVFAAPQASVSANVDVPSRSLPPAKRYASLDIPASPTSALDRADSTGSPAASPSPSLAHTESARRVSSDAGRGSIKVAARPARPPALDHARSLPSTFGGYMPDILSPGRRKEENAARGVLPGSSRPGAERAGPSRFERGSPRSRAVYNWYNPL